jgi:hypothetical protein
MGHRGSARGATAQKRTDMPGSTCLLKALELHTAHHHGQSISTLRHSPPKLSPSTAAADPTEYTKCCTKHIGQTTKPSSRVRASMNREGESPAGQATPHPSQVDPCTLSRRLLYLRSTTWISARMTTGRGKEGCMTWTKCSLDRTRVGPVRGWVFVIHTLAPSFGPSPSRLHRGIAD